MFVVLSLVILLICALLYFYSTLNQKYWQKRGVPIVEPKWFFGNYKDILLGNRHIGLIFQDMYKEFPDALYVGYLKMRQPCIMLRDPELIKTVLAKDFSSFADNDIHVDKDVDFLFGNNPFVLNGEEWKQARNVFVPTISGTRLKTYFPSVLTVCDTMTAYVARQIGGNGAALLEAKSLSGTYTTDVIANAVFGVESNSFEDADNKFYRLTSSLFESTFFENLKVLAVVFFPQLSKILRIRFTTKECEEVLLNLTKKVSKHRLDTGETRNDFFQQMIQYKENDKSGAFTDRHIAAHCFGFMADGYETSSDSMCFILFELAWHQRVQDAVREEIESGLRESGGQVTFDFISSLKYMDMVVSESLRMHPPAMSISRVCTKPYTLPPATGRGERVRLARGTPVTIAVYGLHMDPQHYPDPDRFDPERFRPEAVAARNKYTYLPFGEGPRICVGMKFALMQVKAGLVALLREFRVKPSPRTGYPVAVDPRVLIKRPLNGAWLHFHKL